MALEIAYTSSHGVESKEAYHRIYKIVYNVRKTTSATAYAEVYIDDLWVDTSWRGKGYGRKLLQALENRFKNKGFNNINLVTSAFQAPGFYRKCGYVEEFIRENNHNPRLSKSFFVKFFEDSVQFPYSLRYN